MKETFILASQNHKKNNLSIAENLYKEVLKTNPNHFETIFSLGSLLIQTKNFIGAKQLLKKAILIQPNYAGAYNNLGAVLKEMGEFQQAINCCEKAIQIQPNYASAYNNLGASLKEIGKFRKAIVCFQKAIKIQPNFELAYQNLGLTFQNLRNFRQALNCWKKAIQIQPHLAKLHGNLGKLYVILGDHKKAINCYKKALKYESENLFYYYILNDLEKKTLSTYLKNKIKKILGNKNSTKLNLAYGNFLLSRYELKTKNYKKELSYLLKGHQNFFESQKNKFSKEVEFWFNKLPKIKELIHLDNYKINISKNNNKIKPIFIIGVPRCGSTLIEKIITSSSSYVSAGEETAIISTFINRKIFEKETYKVDLVNLQKSFIEKYEEKGLIKKINNYTFTDKSLENFFYIDLIKKIFPNAKIIDCNRDPFYSIMSIIKNNLPGYSWAHSLKNIFNYFDIYYSITKKFKKTFPNYIYNLKYEKLINNPEIETKKLMKFCNLTWSKKCLEYYKSKDLASNTSSNIQIRKAIYKNSNQKYLPYKKLLNKYGKKYTWYN